MSDFERVHKRIREERRDNKSQVTIINLKTGEVVDRNTLFHDEAEKWAKNKIAGHPELKYRIYT